MRFLGSVEVVLTYDFEAQSKVDADIKMRSAMNRIKNMKLAGIPEIKSWNVTVHTEPKEENE